MTQSFNESLGSSLQTNNLGDGTILMWHKTIQRLASEGSTVSMSPRECLNIHTIRPSNCYAVGHGNVNEDLLRTLAIVSRKGASENPRPEVSYLAIPLNPGVDKRSFHKQPVGLMTNALVPQGTLKMEEADIQRILEPQATTAMALEHINLLLNQIQKPAQRNRIATSTPLLSNELDESDDEFNVSSFSSNVQHNRSTRSMSKDREKPFRELECPGGRSSSVRENQKDVNKALEEKLNFKELELQQTLQLLLMTQHDLEEVRGLSDLKDTEIGLLAEKLKLEGKQYEDNVARFDDTCNSLRDKLLTSKANNRTFVKQLRQLLEKYERLKKRTSAAKKQSYQDRFDKEHALKTLKGTKEELEKLNAEQSLLKNKQEVAQKIAAEMKEKLQFAVNDCEKNVMEKFRLEDEASKMKKEIDHLRDRLQKAQIETLRLEKIMSSTELEKEAAIKQLLESKDQVDTLKQKLDECRVERESSSLQIKEMRCDAKRRREKLKEEMFLVKEDYKACATMAKGLQKETAALSKLVLDLKQDKQLLREELASLRQDKKQLVDKSQQEGKRLCEVIASLEKERDLTLMELGHLRKDYLNMSDRIAERMGLLDQDEVQVYITDCAFICEEATSRQDHQSILHAEEDEDVIQQIKKRLEDEEAWCIQVSA